MHPSGLMVGETQFEMLRIETRNQELQVSFKKFTQELQLRIDTDDRVAQVVQRRPDGMHDTVWRETKE